MSDITRKKHGHGFSYYQDGVKITDQAAIERCNKLAVPPAWRDVTIAKSLRSKIQARGLDNSNRLQYIYHPKFRERQEKLKFDRILRFAANLPNLRRQVDKDLSKKRLSRDKVLATIVHLIDQSYIRVGSQQSAKETGHYGATTLRRKHIEISGDTVTFDFIGKSGQHQHQEITDRQIANIVRRLDELPGYEIFRYQDKHGDIHNLQASDVNQYIKRHMGEEFSAKDFRTWGGTLLATMKLIESGPSSSVKACQKNITEAVKHVANNLGNTPAIARSSYIDPRVITAYESGDGITAIKDSLKSIRPRKYLSRDELCVLKLLDNDK